MISLVYALRQYCLRLDDIGGRNYPTEDQSQGASEREAAYLQCADDIRAMIAAELSDINDAMSKRPIENGVSMQMMIRGRMVRVYPQSAGNLSVWIDNGNHGFTQVPGLVLHSPATSNSEALYRVSGLRPGNSEISTERNLLEMLVRDYLRVTGQSLEVV